MDASRLRTGELIAAVSGIALFIVMFLSWFGAPDVVAGINIEAFEEQIEAAGGDTTISAWQAFDFIDLVLLVTIVVAVGLGVATAMSQTVNLPVAASAVTAGLGILSTLLVLYRVIDPPNDFDREFWLFVGLVLSAGIAAGGWMSMQEEGTSFGAQADRLGDRVGGGDEPPPPPPPSSGAPPSAP
jgi:hypothetical protein